MADQAHAFILRLGVFDLEGGGILAAVIDADDLEIFADRRRVFERRGNFGDQGRRIAGFVQHRNDDRQGRRQKWIDQWSSVMLFLPEQ